MLDVHGLRGETALWHEVLTACAPSHFSPK
jgi:hypothetical protein